MGLLSVRFVLVFLMALLMVFSSLGGCFVVFAVDEAEARGAVVAAEDMVVECYRVVEGADEAGANVTGLLTRLNDAGLLLSKASLAYGEGDFDSAYDLAVQSQGMLNDFVVEANVLWWNALQAQHWDFMVNVVGSAVGAVVVVLGGFFVWFLLKRRYGKAEVVSG